MLIFKVQIDNSFRHFAEFSLDIVSQSTYALCQNMFRVISCLHIFSADDDLLCYFLLGGTGDKQEK